MLDVEAEKERLVDVLLTEGGLAWHDDMVGLAGPENEDEAERLYEAARQMHGQVILVRGRMARLLTPPEVPNVTE